MAPQLLLPALLLLVCTGTHGYLCLDSLSCPDVGYYAKCFDFCDTQYFRCNAEGQAGVLSTCPFGLVFDYDPAGVSSKCVLFEDCSHMSNGCDANPPQCKGVFEMLPACRNCSDTFYFCDPNQATGVHAVCSHGMMFNPVPSHPGCIPESDCPCTDPSC
ncbi:hypothetical protein O3P69_012245 [Scylla paramamosain]|uniref:Uncharacterized protein n=1 Tax=Scylla paramamosain TaxID=85552 RepID=A0AAW0TFG0_SCYPA